MNCHTYLNRTLILTVQWGGAMKKKISFQKVQNKLGYVKKFQLKRVILSLGIALSKHFWPPETPVIVGL